jgi:hypothetical protein
MDKSQTEFKNEMKIAILTQDDNVKEITGEYDQLMSGSNWVTKIFADLESAKKWVK